MEEELTEILNQPRNTLLLLPWVKSLLCCVYMGHGAENLGVHTTLFSTNLQDGLRDFRVQIQ